jgi:WD40 repeat protein
VNPSDEIVNKPSADAVTQMPGRVVVEKTFSLPGIAFCAAKGEDASTLFVGMSDFKIHRIDMAAEKLEAVPICEDSHESYVTGLVRSGGTFVSGGYDGALIWWDAAGGAPIRRVEAAHSKWIRMLAVSPDGTRVASVGDDMRTQVWDAATGALVASWGDYDVKTPHGYPSMLYAVAYSPDGRWLATGDKTGWVLVREVETGEIAARIETPIMYTWDPRARRHSIGGIRSLAFSGDSAILAVGGIGKVGNIDHLEGASRIEVFRWQSSERLHEIEDTKHKGLVEAMRFGPGDAWLAAVGGDHSGFVSVYRMDDGKVAAQEKVGNHLHDFVFGETTDRMLAVGHDQGAVIRLER